MSIPEELKQNALWCGWIRDERKGKIPIDPRTLNEAKTNDPSTFNTFDMADEDRLGGYVDGVGILVGNGYSVIDIDHCLVDGFLSDVALDICYAMESYAEKSPSGDGLHIIFKASDFNFDREKYYLKNPNNGIEVYMSGITNRFMTMTGNTIFGYPIRDNPEALQMILDKYMLRPQKKKQKFAKESHNGIDLSERDIIEKASKNTKFYNLFHGDMSAYNNDHSSADLALCNLLAFWTGRDAAKIDSLFKLSKLYRDKWDREDYKRATIEKAIETCTEVYDPYKPQTIWDKLDTPYLNTDIWTVNADGVSHTVVKNKRTGETEEVVVTSTPIAPAAYLENPETGDCKVEIHYIYNNSQRSFVCDNETLLNKSKIVKLANKGINVTSATANDLTKYFSDMQRLNAKTLPHYSSVAHMGWVGDKFVPYDGGIKFDAENENGSLYGAITQSGELSDWVEFMKPLRKNLYFRLIMAASFSSPLIQRCGCLPYWFHLWGTSGTGKTVALMAAMSAWGDPRMGRMTRTLNATHASMMSTVSFLYNLPFAGDELQTIKSNFKNYDELIMRLTEGVERNRMKYDKNLPDRYWHCAFLSTGEEPITEDNSGGGTKNRVIEVEVDNKVFGRQGNAIVNFILQNYGCAGPAFINYLQKNNFDLQSEYQNLNSQIMDSVSTTDKQAGAAALILLADKIVCDCIFKGEQPLGISDIEPFIKSVEETDIATRAYDWVRSWIAVNENKFNGNSYSETWGKNSLESQTTYVVATILKREMTKEGYSFDAVKKKWGDNGWIEKCGRGYTTNISIGGKKVHCIEVRN